MSKTVRAGSVSTCFLSSGKFSDRSLPLIFKVTRLRERIVSILNDIFWAVHQQVMHGL
jgi:hypothetical protein